MKKQIKRFLREEDGITALEYGILAALVVAAIVFVFKDSLRDLYQKVFDGLDTAVDDAV